MKISVPQIVLGLISLGIGAFLLLGSWDVYADYMRIKDYNGRVMGQLIKKHFTRASDGNTVYYVDYVFISAKGVKVNATGRISKQTWDILKDTDKLAIRYDPSNPQRNFPEEGSGASLIASFFMFLLAGVFVIFGVSRLLEVFKRRKSLK